MPVIVNEMEVVLAEGGEGGQAAAQSPAPPPDPRTTAELLERRARNELRLLAH